MSYRTKSALAIMVALLLLGNWRAAAQSGDKKYRRAKLPKFSKQEKQESSRIFFENVFSTLVGNRPRASRSRQGPGTSVTPTTEKPSENGGDAGKLVWSTIISATTIEDEIKALKLELDKLITTPTAFAGRGYKPARQSFSLLAMLFRIIEQYDGDVRWKSQAPVARDMFARTSANLKAGGSIQVYNEAKQRKLDLGDVVRGSRLEGTAEEDKTWDKIVDRTPLMQLLESRFETNLKQWTNSKSEFNKDLEQVRHEAEMVVAIAEVLMDENMEGAADEEYQQFAQLLKDGGEKVVQGVKAQDVELAEDGVSDISRSCVDCHDSYR
jgi:hypothetical protein